MSQNIDLKQIERKAYLSYYQDGLLDIFLGLGILIFAIGMATDTATYVGGLLGALIIPSWAAAKRFVTIPRLGVVKFGPERKIRIEREKRFFRIFLALTLLAGAALLIPLYAKGIPPWLHAWLKKFIFAPMGLIGVVGLGFLAYWKQINRYYAYAVLVLVAVFVRPILNAPAPQYLISLGLIILLSGLAVLLRFLRNYPISAEGTLDANS